MKRFSSKIGLELTIPLAVLFGGMLIWLMYDQDWAGSAFMVLIIIFTAYNFLTTFYQIEEDTLRIKGGFFIDKSIDIKSIRTITETRNPTGAPAVSLDRLEIIYNQFDSILVSPKDKKRFIHELLNVNPNITVRLKR